MARMIMLRHCGWWFGNPKAKGSLSLSQKRGQLGFQQPIELPFLTICFPLQSAISPKRLSASFCARCGKILSCSDLDLFSRAAWIHLLSAQSHPVRASREGTWLSCLERGGEGNAKGTTGTGQKWKIPTSRKGR